MSETKLEWPPNYTLRRSRRARHIKLHITPHHGLEIVIPYFVSKQEAFTFLESKRAWVEKHAKWLEVEEVGMPSQIELRCLDVSYRIIYQYIWARERISLKEINDSLIFNGAIENVKVCLPLIRRWLKRKAQQHLTQQLASISMEIGLGYTQVCFRGQKTLWGSCSKEGAISLNYKLLFLPQHLVHYVIVHELCHTVHFDHSQSFWRLVERFVPDQKALRKELRQSDYLIPRWYYST